MREVDIYQDSSCGPFGSLFRGVYTFKETGMKRPEILADWNYAMK
jgi:hypothetical protein